MEGDGVLGCGGWRMETTKVVPVSLKLGWLDAITRTEGGHHKILALVQIPVTD